MCSIRTKNTSVRSTDTISNTIRCTPPRLNSTIRSRIRPQCSPCLSISPFLPTGNIQASESINYTLLNRHNGCCVHILYLFGRRFLHHSSISCSTRNKAPTESSRASRIEFLIAVNILILIKFSLRTAFGAGKAEKKLDTAYKIGILNKLYTRLFSQLGNISATRDIC